MLKSVFESELVAEMHKGLIKKANSSSADDLTQAVDHLNSAIGIFEEAGMTVQADRLLNLLEKIASRKGLVSIPIDMARAQQIAESIGIPIDFKLRDKNESDEDYKYRLALQLKNFRNDPLINEKGLKELFGYTYQTPEETEIILNQALNRYNIKEPEETELGDEDIILVASKKKPKNPLKVSDRHTKKLTSDKMVKNLKHHGTVFNMSDDNDAKDLLNNDILDVTMSDDTDYQLSDFEDEL